MTVYFKNLGKYGRMGNCLFQIAATIGAAINKNDSFAFPKWEYQDCFNLPQSCFGHNLLSYSAHNEPHFHYSPIPYLGKHMNLQGYFQSELYFKHCSEKISEYLTPKFQGNFNGMTAIHVRRGDYLLHKDCYNILTKDNYYDIAMEMCPSDKYVIFSDDLSWCKEQFVGDKFIFSEERHPVKDLANMISCTNHIISNSSFSWWGAWLNTNENKIVIAPSNWFGPKLAPTHDTKDLYIEGWVLV